MTSGSAPTHTPKPDDVLSMTGDAVLSEAAYEAGYERGYEAGFKAGCAVGEKAASKTAYAKGYEDGFNVAKEQDKSPTRFRPEPGGRSQPEPRS